MNPRSAALGVVILTLAGGVTSLVHAEEGGALRPGAAARIGMVTREWSPSGLWFEADLLGRLELSRVFYVLGEAGLAVSRDVHPKHLSYYDYSVEEANEDTRLLLAVPLRATFGWRFVEAVSLELGATVGPTRMVESSTQCGDDASWGLVGGPFGGPAFHFGPTRAAVHLQAIYSPVWRCSNGALNPATGIGPWPKRLHESDPAPSLLAVVSHVF